MELHLLCETCERNASLDLVRVDASDYSKTCLSLQYSLFTLFGQWVAVDLGNLQCFRRCTFLVLVTSCETVFAILREPKDVQFALCIAYEMGLLKHLPHIKLTAITMSPKRSLVGASGGGSRVTPPLQCLVDIGRSHATEINAFENRWFPGLSI